jgi:hypothetical protein
MRSPDLDESILRYMMKLLDDQGFSYIALGLFSLSFLEDLFWAFSLLYYSFVLSTSFFSNFQLLLLLLRFRWQICSAIALHLYHTSQSSGVAIAEKATPLGKYFEASFSANVKTFGTEEIYDDLEPVNSA